MKARTLTITYLYVLPAPSYPPSCWSHYPESHNEIHFLLFIVFLHICSLKNVFQFLVAFNLITSLVTREMKIKTTVRHQDTPSTQKTVAP